MIASTGLYYVAGSMLCNTVLYQFNVFAVFQYISPIRVGRVLGKCEYECSLTQDLEAENLPPDMFSSYICVSRVFLICM